MINIKPKKDYLVALESVAMTDIVLNMFIFFFISFSLLYTFEPSRAQKLEIKLPKASNTTPLGEEEQLSITLTNEGVLYLGKVLITTKELKNRIYDWLRNTQGAEKKPDQTDEQFVYSTRKKALGQFKKDILSLPASSRDAIAKEVEVKFEFLFEKLKSGNTRSYVDKYTVLKRVITRKSKPAKDVKIDGEGAD